MRANREKAYKLGREAASRLRVLRLANGYETAADFARAIDYRPSTYQRYERRMPIQAGPAIRLVEAIRRIAPVSLDWLYAGDPARQPRGVPGAKVAILSHANGRR